MNMRFALVALASLVFLVGCSSRTDPPGGRGPTREAPVASQSRTAIQRMSTPQSVASGDSSQAPPPGDVSHGEEAFNQYCAVCHKNGANGAPPLVGVMKRRELPSGTPANDPRVRDTIKMGKANMPGFEGALTEQQISDIIAYLHTM